MDEDDRPVSIDLDLAHAFTAWVEARRLYEDAMLQTIEDRHGGVEPAVRIDQLISLEAQTHDAFVHFVQLLAPEGDVTAWRRLFRKRVDRA